MKKTLSNKISKILFASAISISASFSSASSALASEGLKIYGGVDALYQNSKFEGADKKSSSFIKNSPQIFVGIDDGSFNRLEISFNRLQDRAQGKPTSQFSSSSGSSSGNSGSSSICAGGEITINGQVVQNGGCITSGSSGGTSNSSSGSISRSTYKITSTNLNFDYKPYLSIAKGLQINGLLGLSYQGIKFSSYTYTNKGSSTSSTFSSKSTSFIAPAVGVGTQYEITKDFFARAQLRYTYLNKTILSTKLKSTTSIGLGVGYYF